MKKALPLLLALAATQVSAQAPATQPPADMIAPPTCETPYYPGRTANEKAMDKFNKTLAAYQKCMNEYVTAQTELAKGAQTTEVGLAEELNALEKKKLELKNKLILVQDKQKRHIDSRNQAVNELNSYLIRVKKEAGQ